MDEWSEKVKGILTQRSKRKDEVEIILKEILDSNKIGFRCEFEITDVHKLIWDITLSDKNFTLTNEEISEGQNIEYENENGFFNVPNGEKKDLEETIKEIILTKLD